MEKIIKDSFNLVGNLLPLAASYIVLKDKEGAKKFNAQFGLQLGGNISKSTSSILQIIDDVKDLLAKKNHPLLAKRQMDLTQTYNYYDAQLVHYADAYIKHDTVTGRLTLEVGNDNGTFNVYQGVCSNHQSSDVYSLVGRNAKGLTLWIVGQVKSKDFIVQVLHAFNDREEFQWAGYNYMTPKKK